MNIDEIKKKYQTDSINETLDFEVTERYKTPIIKAKDSNEARAKARKMAENILKKNGFYNVKTNLRDM